jgi:hypothetical protein
MWWSTGVVFDKEVSKLRSIDIVIELSLGRSSSVVIGLSSVCLVVCVIVMSLGRPVEVVMVS